MKRMSDSSDDEDLSRFKDVVDNSFIKVLNEPSGISISTDKDTKKPKSERYLEEASHYNDVKVPEEMQKRIGAKLSAIIDKNIEFIDVQQNGFKKHKIKGGIKLFRNSESFLSCEEAKDTYTEEHNRESKKIKKKRREVEPDGLDETEKISASAVNPEHIMSKKETKWWKSRRKEKLFKYKSHGKSKVLTAIE